MKYIVINYTIDDYAEFEDFISALTAYDLCVADGHKVALYRKMMED